MTATIETNDGIENRYDHIQPWDAESRLFAIQQYGAVTIAQVRDGDTQLVTVTRDELDAMCLEDGGELSGHPGTWSATGRTRAPLSGWSDESEEIIVRQTKFTTQHEAVLTRVDAAELLAHFPAEVDG